MAAGFLAQHKTQNKLPDGAPSVSSCNLYFLGIILGGQNWTVSPRAQPLVKLVLLVTLQQGTRTRFLQTIGNCLFVIMQINACKC